MGRRRCGLKLETAIKVMREIVSAYDKIEAKKLKIKNRKGGNFMKFGTIIGIVVGVIVLIAAGAAAAYFFLNKKNCCDDCCCDDCFEDFPEEEIIEDFEEIQEAPAEETAE